jgi:hypothetical protein
LQFASGPLQPITGSGVACWTEYEELDRLIEERQPCHFIPHNASVAATP